ncbi:ribonuclease H-like domain-containing protein [Tanacetum coccineum]
MIVYVVFDGAFRGVRDEEVIVGEGVMVTSSSLDMLTNSCLGWIMTALFRLRHVLSGHYHEESGDEFRCVWYENVATDTQGQIKVLPPRTAEEIIARERERKTRTTLLMALPKDHLAKFHKMTSSECDTCESNISTEPSELVSEPVVIESNVESQPKVWSDAPIIEEYESDSEDECVSIPTKQQETPSFANQQVKTPRETVKNQYTHSQKPKVDKKDLGYGFAVRACFVCGSLNHLIKDCDFHEKRMARKAELNNGWNNVQRVNKQNQFVPSAVLTRTGIIPVNTARASSTKNFSTARQSVNRQTVLTNTAMKVNTVKPIVNRVRPANLVLLGEKGKLLLSPQQVVVGDHKDTMVDPNTIVDPVLEIDYPHRALKNKGIVDSGCSRHMTGNKAYLDEFQDFNGGPVAFGGSRGYITGKGKIKTGKLDFEDVCFVKELQHFNLFSVSQMCDKKNKVLFTDSECLVLSSEFKLPDENQVLLKIPRQNNMYSFNLENIVPSGGLACLIAKATNDESNKWHRRLGHVNFKNLNKLVKGNLVRGLPSKIFQNDHTCVACQKGKQHKASYDKREGPREEEQVFMDELERLKRQEKKLMREKKKKKKKLKHLKKDTPAKASSTNLVNIVSIPVSTASPYEGLSLSDPTNPEEDDSEIATGCLH